MKYLLLFILISGSLISAGQSCDCEKNIAGLLQFIEENQASYQHQVVEMDRRNEYQQHKSHIIQLAARAIVKRDCADVVALYLDFFRDEHSFLGLADTFDRKQHITSANRKKTKKPDFRYPHGIWHFSDSSFSVRMVPQSGFISSWAGVIEKDNSRNWKPGQVKIDFFITKKGELRCIYRRQNLVPRAFPVVFSDSVMRIGRNLTFYRTPPSPAKAAVQYSKPEFKSLSEHTNSIHLPSFDLSQKHSIDSVILSNFASITSKPNLVIDIRNNGGGGFGAFDELLPFISDRQVVDQPFYASVWNSPYNLNYYDSVKYEFAETAEDSAQELSYVDFLKRYAGQFSPIEPDTQLLPVVHTTPQRIALLFNRYSASSAEGLILTAKQSSKVITIGENSAGAVSYGDWITFQLPELDLWVAVTTKKMIFPNNEYFESVGIAPEHHLDTIPPDLWLEKAVNLLENK
ncbi:MAG: S41 family peptidase [Bacteroidota bacterium]